MTAVKGETAADTVTAILRRSLQTTTRLAIFPLLNRIPHSGSVWRKSGLRSRPNHFRQFLGLLDQFFSDPTRLVRARRMKYRPGVKRDLLGSYRAPRGNQSGGGSNPLRPSILARRFS